VALITIIRLLLFILSVAGIDEKLIGRRRGLADRVLLGRFDNPVAVSVMRVIDIVGIVIRDASHPDRRIVGRQKIDKEAYGRGYYNKMSSTVGPEPGAIVKVVAAALVNNGAVMGGEFPHDMAVHWIRALKTIP
jgi:hypothetical protein